MAALDLRLPRVPLQCGIGEQLAGGMALCGFGA